MTVFAMCAISCSNDDFGVDKGGVHSSYPSVIGTWADITQNDVGETGLSWTFDNNGRATQRAWFIMYGATLRDVKVNFSYKYDGKNITTTDVDGNQTIHSVNITSNTMFLGDGAGGYFTLIKQ